MNLEEKRKEWENGYEVVLVVTDKETYNDNSSYSTVYVVLNVDGEYALHRYFPMSDMSWEVSVDISNSTLERCLEAVSISFKYIYPDTEIA